MKPKLEQLIEKNNQENNTNRPYMDNSVLEDCFTEEDGSLTFSFSEEEEEEEEESLAESTNS